MTPELRPIEKNPAESFGILECVSDARPSKRKALPMAPSFRACQRAIEGSVDVRPPSLGVHTGHLTQGSVKRHCPAGERGWGAGKMDT